MHKNEFTIDEPLVHSLLSEQFPHWAKPPIEPILSSGTDHALFRLGSE